MPLVLADRVQENTTTTGTGTITLAGATAGFNSFSVIGDGNTTYYTIVGGTQWEVGLGTYTSSGTTLSRDTVLSSSNSNALVDFSAGVKTVFVTYPAGKSVYYGASGNVGIGTDSPLGVLDVASSSNPLARIRNTTGGGTAVYFQNSDTGTTSTDGFAVGVDTSENAYLYNYENTAMYFATNNAERVRITSAGDVGIGTSTANKSSSSIALTVNTGTAANFSAVEWASGDTLNYHINANNSAIYHVAAGTRPWIVYTNGSERMRIDSAGRITTPSQPFFMGFPTTNYSGGGMPAGILAFTATYNNGNCFNASNSRFTAPVAGWYKTTWGGLQLGSTVTSLMVNGVRVHNGNHFITGASYVNMTQTAIRNLNAGDYLNVEGWNGGGYFNSWYLWTVEMIG